MSEASSSNNASRADVAGQFGLGAIDQVAYVVNSLDDSLPAYEAIYGSFELGDSPLSGCTMRGRQIDCHLRLAVNRSGPIEIELIEVVSGETPHSEHLLAHGEGLHHVRFTVSDIDTKIATMEAGGCDAIFYKRFGPTVAFAYIELPESHGRSIVELLELP